MVKHFNVAVTECSHVFDAHATRGTFFMANYVCTNIAMPNWPVKTCLIFTQICRSARSKTWPLDCHLSWLCSQNRSSKCEDAQYWWILSILISNYIFCPDECHNVNLVSFICFHLQVSSTADLMFGGFQKKEFHRFCETSYTYVYEENPKIASSVLAGPNIFLLLEISHHIFDKLDSYPNKTWKFNVFSRNL